MIFSMIVAAAANDVIGADGALPWRIRADSRRFRALTTGHVVLLGRVTHESIVTALGRPLPGRTSVVVTRASPPPAGEDTEQVRWAGSVRAGLDLAEQIAAAAGDTEVFIAGGVSVYRDTLPVTGRIYLTRVHQDVPGDRSMPPGWLTGFELVRREDGRDDQSQLSYSFLDYERAQR